MQTHWHYRTQKGDAGLNRKPPRFKDLGEHSIRIFVREVLQNNMDAADNGNPITVGITISEWGKKEISSFFDFVGEDHIQLLKKSGSYPDPAVAPYLKECLEIISGKKNTSFLIIVEETNCIGLLGPIRESQTEKSHFDALMRKVENNEAKKETTNSGGTWGKGSSIFTYTSQLWTWFSYSHLSTPWLDKETNILHSRRFIGRCMLAPFFDEKTNESYLGDGWFCKKDHKIDAYPFINEEADKFASQLGVQINHNKPGTTFYVPFFKPVLENGNEKVSVEAVKDEFVEQILQNWFIPIFNNALTINLTIGTRTITISKSFLSTVPQLKFKLQILEWYEKGCPPDKRFHRESIEVEVPALRENWLDNKTDFAKERQKVHSDLVVRVLDEDEDFNDSWSTINKVALCRNKGMIIVDEEAIQSTSFRAESIFFGGLLANSEASLAKRRHLDLFLAYAENPAHNTWCRYPSDYDRCFLERFERTRSKPESSIKYLFNEIYGVFKKLLGDEAEQSENKDICSVFKKLARLKSKGDESGGKALFLMRTVEEPVVDHEGRYVFSKRVISNVNDGDIEVYFKTFIDSLEGEKDKDFDSLGITEFTNLELIDAKGAVIEEGDNPKIYLMPEQEMTIKIRTCKIEKNSHFKNLEPLIKATAIKTEHE